MTKATPEMRRRKHDSVVNSQLSSVKLEEKMWGHESNKSSKYNQSPVKY